MWECRRCAPGRLIWTWTMRTNRSRVVKKRSVPGEVGADAHLGGLRRPRDRDEPVAEPVDGDRGHPHGRRLALSRRHGAADAPSGQQRARAAEPERGPAGLRAAEGFGGRGGDTAHHDQPDASDPQDRLPRPRGVLQAGVPDKRPDRLQRVERGDDPAGVPVHLDQPRGGGQPSQAFSNTLRVSSRSPTPPRRRTP